MIEIKSKHEIELMREAGKILCEMHNRLGEMIRPGMSTGEVNEKAEGLMKKLGGFPSMKGLYDFPAACCVSVNDEVIHGIPDFHRILKDGDIVSIDTCTSYRGYNADATRTWAVGNISDNAKHIIEVCQDSFWAGVKNAVPGNHLNDICAAIGYYAEDHGCGVLKEYVGHGIGHEIHMDPEVPNYDMHRKGPKLAAGMVLAIEPMIAEESGDVHTLDNGWTVVTDNGKLGCHYENTVLITDNGPEVLTLVK
ncbi:type I methionyl aminopeptidase [Oribacterium sp. HCP28S3_H8]|jgi:methionyl aminopeptidase|uniref:type I methionyl aminopeptidase n=1 Tax=Oribacterium sp. HCP28S3_H8 TaxID=3438945 RepID=UPI003032E192|nr:type I methionyl aminopeptidase [Oribacterium sp.]